MQILEIAITEVLPGKKFTGELDGGAFEGMEIRFEIEVPFAALQKSCEALGPSAHEPLARLATELSFTMKGKPLPEDSRNGMRELMLQPVLSAVSLAIFDRERTGKNEHSFRIPIRDDSEPEWTHERYAREVYALNGVTTGSL
jgi:hypothetical protein